MTGKEIKEWAAAIGDDEQVPLSFRGRPYGYELTPASDVTPATITVNAFRPLARAAGPKPADTGKPDMRGFSEPERRMAREWLGRCPDLPSWAPARAVFYMRRIRAITGVQCSAKARQAPFPFLRYLVYRELGKDGLTLAQAAGLFGFTPRSVTMSVDRNEFFAENFGSCGKISGVDPCDLAAALDRARDRLIGRTRPGQPR